MIVYICSWCRTGLFWKCFSLNERNTSRRRRKSYWPSSYCLPLELQLLKICFGAFQPLMERTARYERGERGGKTCRKSSRLDSNTGPSALRHIPLYMCACSTNWANPATTFGFFWVNILNEKPFINVLVVFFDTFLAFPPMFVSIFSTFVDFFWAFWSLCGF